MKVKQGESVLFLKINLSTTITMKRYHRELSIDKVVLIHAKKEIVALYKEIVEGTISDGWI